MNKRSKEKFLRLQLYALLKTLLMKRLILETMEDLGLGHEQLKLPFDEDH